MRYSYVPWPKLVVDDSGGDCSVEEDLDVGRLELFVDDKCPYSGTAVPQHLTEPTRRIADYLPLVTRFALLVDIVDVYPHCALACLWACSLRSKLVVPRIP